MVLEWQCTFHVCVLSEWQSLVSLLQATTTYNLSEQPLMIWWVEQCSHLFVPTVPLTWPIGRRCTQWMRSELVLQPSTLTSPPHVLVCYRHWSDLQLHGSSASCSLLYIARPACMWYWKQPFASCVGSHFVTPVHAHRPYCMFLHFYRTPHSPHHWGCGLNLIDLLVLIIS